MQNQKHQSSVAAQHKLLAKTIAIIHGTGDQGIKRGQLILKSGIPVTQWPYYHNVLQDLDDIEWNKSKRTYYSLKENHGR